MTSTLRTAVTLAMCVACWLSLAGCGPVEREPALVDPDATTDTPPEADG